MPSRDESTRARERLQTLTPVSDEASLSKMDKEAAQYLREAQSGDTLRPGELFSAMVEAVARDYFRRVRQAQVKPVRRRPRV